VDDYVQEAKKHIPDKMRNMEDVLLLWLSYHNYDSEEALKTLI
jgi:hypothetical protein